MGYRLIRETSIPTGADEFFGVKLAVTVGSIVPLPSESSSAAEAEEIAAPQNSSSGGLGNELPTTSTSSSSLSSSAGDGATEADLEEPSGEPGISSSSSGFSGDLEEPSDQPTIGDSSSLSSSSGIPANDNAIFLFKRGATTSSDVFLGVCSPRDLAVWPPVRSDAKAFYRLDRVELTFRAEVVMETAWTQLVSDVTALSNANDALAQLSSGETVTFEFEDDTCTVLRSSSSSARGMRVFNLTLSPIALYPSEEPAGYRMLVTCASDCGDPKIFLHRDDQPDMDGDVHSRPIAVCSPGDLVDYPTDLPDDDQFPAFYRTADFDIVSNNPILLADVWERIKVDTELLAAALYTHENVITETLIEDVA